MRGVTPGRRCAAALLVTETGRYLMQRRDAFGWINFPDVWASFGGAIEPGEKAAAAIRRELREELGYEPPSAVLYTEFSLVMPFPQPRRERISFFVVPIAETRIDGLVLREGAGMALFRAEQLAALDKVAPWDLAAVLMHARGESLFHPAMPRPAGPAEGCARAPPGRQ